MKKLLLYLFILGFGYSYSQTCSVNVATLNAYISPATWGIMPDTNDNLPPAFINVQYDTILSFKLPLYADELDPTLPHIQLDNLKLLNITGLPAGITFTSAASTTDSIHCDNANCKWNAGAIGCLRIKGTPTVTGVFRLVITLEGKTVGGPLAQTGTGDINGYKLNITPVGIAAVAPPKVELSQNSPNPFANYTTIKYSVSKSSKANFYVMNLLGEIVYKNSYNATQGDNKIKFDASDLNKGIYMYTIEVDGVKMTKRMVIEK